MHTCTRTHTHRINKWQGHTHCLSLFLSHTLTHTDINAHQHTHTHTHTHTSAHTHTGTLGKATGIDHVIRERATRTHTRINTRTYRHSRRGDRNRSYHKWSGRVTAGNPNHLRWKKNRHSRRGDRNRSHHKWSGRVTSGIPAHLRWKKTGTLGAATGIDHIISDRVASPPEYQLIYAEKLLLLQTPYLPNDYVATVAEPELARKLLPQDDAVCVCVCVFVRVCVCVCAWCIYSTIMLRV